MANDPVTNPDLDSQLGPSVTPDETDILDQQPDQTPIDSLNDILDSGQNAKDTFDDVKDLKEKVQKWRGKGAEKAVEGAETAGETAVTGGAEGAAVGTEAATATEAAAGTAAKSGAKQALKNETVAAGRSGWLNATKGKIAEGQAKVAARQAARTAERQAVKQAGKAAAKYGAKAAARWAAEAASGLADAGLSWILLAADVLLTAAYALIKKYGKYIAAGAAVFIALPGLIFAFYFGSIGATLTAGTPAEKAQTIVALALGADPSSGREIIIKAADLMKERLTGIIKLLPGGAPAIAIADGIQAKLLELTKIADQPEQRKILMADINADLKKISDAHPDVLFSSGTCADLKPYIDTGKFKDTRPGRMKDMQTIWKGVLNRGNHREITKDEEGPIPANPRLCSVIKFILDNGFTLESATITYGHRQYSQPKRNIESQHYYGEAIDLAVINGVYGGKKWQEETRKLQQLLSENAKSLYLYELWGPHAISIDNCSPTTRRIGGHDDHIHIGIANASKSGACK